MSPRVALINMPFANAERPSLALGTLKALAREQGWLADVHNFNLRFARRIGTKAYAFLCGSSVMTKEQTRRLTVSMDYLVGEWLFAQLFYGMSESRVAEYAEFLLAQSDFAPSVRDAILEIRFDVGPFLTECLESVDWSAYTAVGFTSTFEQTMASLCLARELKTRLPQLKVLLGGANCEGVMGRALARNFPFLDIVCTGEADIVFPRLLQALHDHGEWWRVPGFVARAPQGMIENPAAPLTVDLNALPYPDFDEYFAERARGGLPIASRAVILETSRGCWWGQRSHCTFCGLNGSTMAFRVKSAERALQEFRTIVARYELDHVDYSDNILHRDYLATFLPELSREDQRRKRPVTVFYETKSNLKRDELRLLSEARVLYIQPGIESFDDSVLRLMGKGVRGLHNVAVLKWGKVYGISVMWNLIFGFPGEAPHAYAQMSRLCKRIVHLEPPRTVSPIRLDRFSPNFTRAEEKGLRTVRPKPAYGHVFDLPGAELADLAYFFDFSYHDERDPFSYTLELDQVFEEWQKASQGNAAVLRGDLLSDGGLRILDTRCGPDGAERRLTREEAALYAYFDSPHSTHSALELAEELDYTEAQLAGCLEKWDAEQLIARQGDVVLSLAVIDDQALVKVTHGRGLRPAQMSVKAAC